VENALFSLLKIYIIKSVPIETVTVANRKIIIVAINSLVLEVIFCIIFGLTGKNL
jgi:hypothetical protein